MRGARFKARGTVGKDGCNGVKVRRAVGFMFVKSRGYGVERGARVLKVRGNLGCRLV